MKPGETLRVLQKEIKKEIKKEATGENHSKKQTKKLQCKRFVALLLAVALLPLMPLQSVKAATESVSIQLTYGQTQARDLVTLINGIRQNWNQENSQDIADGKEQELKDLVYDYGLEQTAMNRAAEIALAYSSTQADESLSCLVSSAAAVCDGWKSNRDSAEYQKMTSGTYQYVGVGHVVYNGHDYWVAVYSANPSSSSFVGPLDGVQVKSVAVDSSYITNRQISNTPPTTLNLNVGETYDLGNCAASIQVSAHYPAGEVCPLNGSASVQVADPSVVSYSGTSLMALKAGSTNVTISCGGLTATSAVVVTQPTLAQATVSAIADQNYTGYAITPTVTVKIGNTTLVENRDYTLKYENNTNVGTAFVTVTGIGSYSGTKSAYFRIVTPSVSNATITTIPDQSYTGYAICPAVTVYVSNRVLRENTDYTVAYTNNINMGTATVTITGMGSYSGTRTATFRITGPNLSSATIAAIPDQLYTGADIRPSLTVTVNGMTLVQNTDYYVSYTNNRNAGTATVTITGRGNYSGSRTTTFRILAKNIANASVGSIDTQRYTGNEICPSVTVTIGSTVLQRNVDYTLSYQDNRRPGTASITINGTGTYSGSKTVTFKIAQASISSATVKVSNQTYNGEERTPSVTVKLNGETLEEDDDFEVEYRNNVKPGQATVVIYGQGDYSGSKKATFVIKPAKVTWRSIKSKGKSVVLKWKQDSRVAGYEVYRSKKKSSGFTKLGTLAKGSYNTCTNTNLSSGTYYYRLRSYVVVDGTKYYSAYSSVKKVTVR